MSQKKHTKLGQHFLTSKGIAEKAVETASIKSDDIIIEVGPGKGMLTEELLKTGAQIIAVEKDGELANFIGEKFKDYKNLEIVCSDALKIVHQGRIRLGRKNYKVVANIPYYITSRLIRIFLETKNQPNLMVLMVQKEVAERIVAIPPKSNLLSLSVQVYGSPKIIKIVKKGNFFPVPEVDSALIKIEDISKNFFTKNKINEKDFFAMLKKAFSQKRKILKNSLKLDLEKIKKCGLKEKARPQELSLGEWRKLYKHLTFDI